MLSVAYVTPPAVQRRFSTQGTLPFTPRQSGVDCTCWRRRRCPSEKGVLKNSARSLSSCASDEYPAVRSQSVQSLSPGVKAAGARSELRYPSAWVETASVHSLDP